MDSINRKAVVKNSFYAHSHEYVKVHDGNVRAFLIDLIICRHVKITKERIDFYLGFY